MRQEKKVRINFVSFWTLAAYGSSVNFGLIAIFEYWKREGDGKGSNSRILSDIKRGRRIFFRLIPDLRPLPFPNYQFPTIRKPVQVKGCFLFRLSRTTEEGWGLALCRAWWWRWWGWWAWSRAGWWRARLRSPIPWRTNHHADHQKTKGDEFHWGDLYKSCDNNMKILREMISFFSASVSLSLFYSLSFSLYGKVM